ncbi:MAG: D-psicose/D-tagatose/L-ribulose 3-epimerase [Candidatus Atribacteria bacterium]|nr:D-psicose/D-tagatose/L-ribulose 3-epimerase [Candidatus Atribacteria bacterium]
MKYGIFALLFFPRFTKERLSVFEQARGLGYEGVEISLSEDFLSMGITKDVAREAKRVGVDCLCSTSLDETTDIASEDKKIRENGIEFLKKCVVSAAELGSDVLGGVIYAPWGLYKREGRKQEEWEFCKESLAIIADFAKEHNVFLAIEPVNRFESYLLNTACEAKKLIDEIGHPQIKIHLDTFQMNIEEDRMYNAIKSAGDLLFHFHCCASHRGIPGTGHVEWDEVFKGLKEVGYDRWLVVESFTPEIMKEEFGWQVAIWRKIAESEEIAKKGLEFLKHCYSNSFEGSETR